MNTNQDKTNTPNRHIINILIAVALIACATWGVMAFMSTHPLAGTCLKNLQNKPNLHIVRIVIEGQGQRVVCTNPEILSFFKKLISPAQLRFPDDYSEQSSYGAILYLSNGHIIKDFSVYIGKSNTHISICEPHPLECLHSEAIFPQPLPANWLTILDFFRVPHVPSRNEKLVVDEKNIKVYKNNVLVSERPVVK